MSWHKKKRLRFLQLRIAYKYRIISISIHELASGGKYETTMNVVSQNIF